MNLLSALHILYSCVTFIKQKAQLIKEGSFCKWEQFVFSLFLPAVRFPPLLPPLPPLPPHHPVPAMEPEQLHCSLHTCTYALSLPHHTMHTIYTCIRNVLYMCIYIYLCVHIYVHIFMLIYLYAYTYIYLVCKCVYMYGMYDMLYTYMYVYTCRHKESIFSICMCIKVCMFIHTHTQLPYSQYYKRSVFYIYIHTLYLLSSL